MKDDKQTTERARKNYIIESNNLAQTKQNDLTMQQMKIVHAFISKIRMTDDGTKEYTATIGEICDICGFDKSNGFYYVTIKRDLIRLSQPSWERIGTDPKTGRAILATISWFSKVIINEGDGEIAVYFDRDLWPDLFNLRRDFTKFELEEILPFKSKYAIRLYEILISKVMSRERKQLDRLETIEIIFDTDDLKGMLNAREYSNFSDFKKRVLSPAVSQINKYSKEIRIDDIFTSTNGNKIKSVSIPIRYTTTTERMQAQRTATIELNKKRKTSGRTAAAKLADEPSRHPERGAQGSA